VEIADLVRTPHAAIAVRDTDCVRAGWDTPAAGSAQQEHPLL
jgi:hypothetical protein